MNIRRFTANNAKKAIEDVYNELGPDAVVLNIRKLTKPGLQGLFQSPGIEVSACAPSATVSLTKGESVAPNSGGMQTVKQHGGRLDMVDDIPITLPKPSPPGSVNTDNTIEPELIESTGEKSVEPSASWGAEQLLDSIGIQPLAIDKLIRMARHRFPQHGELTVKGQLKQIRFCILDYWGRLLIEAKKTSQPRKLLLGPPGHGKTTTICKWMTQTVLAKREPTRIWRLDSDSTNTAEMLTVHAEMLDVPVERVWKEEEFAGPAIEFVDLPGVPPNDAEGMRVLTSMVNKLRPAECLLVLNSAYELDHLIRLVRSFGELPVQGLVMTHLDEETRWSKLWNLTLVTGMPIRYCSSGQEMPGDFVETSPQNLFNAVIKQEDSEARIQEEKCA